jgi:non-ribosomal peptide synthetase component F
MPRGLDLLVSQIAITLTGAAWLPFDADAPVERIAVCLGDCAASGLITAASNAEKAVEAGVAVWSPEAWPRPALLLPRALSCRRARRA